MKSLVLVMSLVMSWSSLAIAAADNKAPSGFKALFNGKSLKGWVGYQPNQNPEKIYGFKGKDKSNYEKKMKDSVKKHWGVKKGAIVSDGHGVHLATKKMYGDFEFRVDWKLGGPTVDSGIYLRDVPQVQIWNPDNKAQFPHGNQKGSGGLWNNPGNWAGKDPLVRADNPVGQWNTFRITMVGSFVTIYLNDKLVVDHAEMSNYFKRNGLIFKEGKIQLQTHGGLTYFKNIYVREFSADESNAYLRSKNKGLSAIFNGKDLSGWGGRGAKGYLVEDGGVLHCPKGAAGNLRYEKQLADFNLDFEFKLKPGTNNGLGVRYVANKDAAYHGNELQILDNTAKKYAGLKPYQFHGSCYGVAPAKREFARKVGEWNYQNVIADGTKIKVYLNGYRILDIDLTDFKQRDNHPGMLYKKGHIGFLGHGDEIWFKGVRVKELNK